MKKFKRSQAGTAIVMALFIMALIAAASVAMMKRFSIDIRRTELFINDLKASEYAQGSLGWAVDQLKRNLSNLKSEPPPEIMPLQLPALTKDGYTLETIIYDLQANFNLNSVTDKIGEDNFLKLLSSLKLKNPEQSELVTQAALDWQSPAATPCFNHFYSEQEPSYKAPHRPLTSLSEARLFKGMDAKLYSELKKYVTALPPNTPININNAPLPVLLTLSPTMTEASALAIIQQRRRSPFKNKSEFMNFEVVKNNTIAENKITVRSDYFLVATTIRHNEQELLMNTLVHRIVRNNRPQINIIWQNMGNV